jgi:hypothetical protein
MTVLRAPFSAGLPGSHPGLSRSLSWAVILRLDVCFRASSVKLIYRCQHFLLLRACQFRCSARHHHRKKTIQSP